MDGVTVPDRVLLVDDVCTKGSTLRSAWLKLQWFSGRLGTVSLVVRELSSVQGQEEEAVEFRIGVTPALEEYGGPPDDDPNGFIDLNLPGLSGMWALYRNRFFVLF